MNVEFEAWWEEYDDEVWFDFDEEELVKIKKMLEDAWLASEKATTDSCRDALQSLEEKK